MAGHMQHGPHSAGEWINELLWTACFVSVAVISGTLHAKAREVFLVGSIVLVFSRLLLGSLGGTGALVELPVLIIMNTLAAGYVIRPQLFVRVPETPLLAVAGSKTRTSLCVLGLLVLAALAAWQYFHR